MNKTRRNKRKRKLAANKAAPKRIMIQCSTLVDRGAVTRTNVDGVEHITITSKTLPDNIVMNGVLYPVDEVNAGFGTLERTLAPVEHPTDNQGNYISANDPVAIHNFHAGAFNENVRQENGRISVDKVINVQEALKSEKGRRLLDRINELETSDDPRPVHTSVGVFLEIEELAEPATNAAGQEYSQIARNLLFDHDAILLDSVGAAQPHQGVGMAVNEEGDELETQSFMLNEELVTVPTTDIEEISHEELRDKLFDALNTAPLSADWVVRVFDSRVIYSLDEALFSVGYEVGNGVVTITGIPLPVEKEEQFNPKTNQEGEAMKELILNALKKAKVTLKGNETDTELFALYQSLNANQDDDGGEGDNDQEAEADSDSVNSAESEADGGQIVDALNAINKRLDGMDSKINANATKELDHYAEIIGKSDKFPGLDVNAAKKLPLESLKSMAANCGVAHALPGLSVVNNNSTQGSTRKRLEMPK